MQMKPIKKKTRAPKLPSGRIFDEISRLLPQQGISGADHANGAKSACSPFSRRSAPPFLAFRCDLGVSYILLTGDRGFESFSLQRGVCCEPDFPGRIPCPRVPVSGPSTLKNLHSPSGRAEGRVARLTAARGAWLGLPRRNRGFRDPDGQALIGWR